MTTRRDLLLEIGTQLDGSGDYVGDWVETAGVFKVRIVAKNIGGATVAVEEADGDENVTYYHTVGVGGGGQATGEVALASRLFRLVIEGGGASATFYATVRAVSESGSHGLV